MKMKRFLRYFGMGILAVIVLGTLGMIVWATTGTLEAQEVALAALESTDAVTVASLEA